MKEKKYIQKNLYAKRTKKKPDLSVVVVVLLLLFLLDVVAVLMAVRDVVRLEVADGGGDDLLVPRGRQREPQRARARACGGGDEWPARGRSAQEGELCVGGGAPGERREPSGEVAAGEGRHRESV